MGGTVLVMVGLMGKSVISAAALYIAMWTLVPWLLPLHTMQHQIGVALFFEREVVGMIWQACGVGMGAWATGEACQPSPKLPWSGGLLRVFPHRFAWT